MPQTLPQLDTRAKRYGQIAEGGPDSFPTLDGMIFSLSKFDWFLISYVDSKSPSFPDLLGLNFLP